MLDWTREADGWTSDGYRIRLVAPYHWELLGTAAADAAVVTDRTPLAVTRTLTECKREAELLDAATRIREVRQRYWGLLVLAVVGFIFVPSFGPPGDLAAIIVLLLLAVRAIGFLAGTYMARSHLYLRDLFYQ